MSLIFNLSGVISPFSSNSILSTYQPGEFIFQWPIFLPFQTVHGVLETRIQTWFVIPFSRGLPFFFLNSPPWPMHPGWPCIAWFIASLSYTKLWSTWSFYLGFCDCGFCSGACWIVFLASSVCSLREENKRPMQAFWWQPRWQSRQTCPHLLLQEHQNWNWLLNNNWLEDVGTYQRKIHYI